MSLDCTKVHNTKTDAKKDIKIAFFDIDGTLIDIGTKVVSRRMLDTLIRSEEERHQNLYCHRPGA